MNYYSPASYEGYDFPVWADTLGLLMGLTTLVPFFAFAIHVIWKREYVSTNCKFRPNRKKIVLKFGADWMGIVPANKRMEATVGLDRKSIVSLLQQNRIV